MVEAAKALERIERAAPVRGVELVVASPGRATTLGAAFLAMEAEKPIRRGRA